MNIDSSVRSKQSARNGILHQQNDMNTNVVTSSPKSQPNSTAHRHGMSLRNRNRVPIEQSSFCTDESNSNASVLVQPIPIEKPVAPIGGYNVRNRKRVSEGSSCPPPAKRSRALVVRKEPTPKLIQASKDVLAEGTIVLAKMRSFAAWPARILSFGKTYVNVHFFGDDSTGHVPYDKIGLFEDNHQLLKCNLEKKINGYTRAVAFVEQVLGIPKHLSILQ